MNLIDRHIAKMFVGYFLAASLVFLTLFVVVDALGLVSQFPNVPFETFAQYYSLSLPGILYVTLPVGLLLAALFTISSMQKNNELMALMSCGMSFMRILAPVVVLALFISGSVFYLSQEILPRANLKKNFIFYNEMKKNPGLFSVVKNEKIWYRDRDKLFYLKTLNDKSRTAQGLTLYQMNDQWQLMQMYSAKEVILGEKQWTLKEGSVTLFTSDSSFPMTSYFTTKVIPMSQNSDDLASMAKTADILTLPELKGFIANNKRAGLDTLRYEVDYWSKFAFPFAGVVLVLLGLPFVISRARSGGNFMSLGVCLLSVIVYWTLYNASLTLGNVGIVPPWIAPWVANILGLILAGYLFRRLPY